MVYGDVRVTEVKKSGERDIEVDYDIRPNKGLCGVTPGQKYWMAVRRGLFILLRKDGV